MKPINFTKDYKATYNDSNIEKSTSFTVPDVTCQVAVTRGIYPRMTKLQYLSSFKKQRKSIDSKLDEKKTSSLGGVLKSESNLSTMRNKSTRHKVELGRRSTLPICSANVVSANTTDISNLPRVQKILRLFQMTYDHFLKEGKGRPKTEGNRCSRPDLRAAQVVEEKFGRCLPSIGAIPGVKIGDKFNFRAELALVGLHMPLQSGIGTNFSVLANPNEHRLCTSVVATSRWYENDMNDPDYLIYSGHGGFGKKECEDQKLLSGNKALIYSKIKKNEVRVIRARIENGKQVYIYDGLYLVEKCYKVRGKFGKLVFKFGLKRVKESK